jgi:lipid A 4'-phosphatase
MNKALFVYITLAALALIVFAIWPELDLAGARYFYHEGGFFGRNSFERFGRDFFRVTPFVVLVAYAALRLATGFGAKLRWAPSGRAMIFLIATMIIGPGLIVNIGLKDHWHRPRPIQTRDFNGPSPFTPWYDDNGGCKKNCSFVSGEAATGFWMVAPASVLPPPLRGPAMVAAFAFGVGASLLRLAFGGHYLSDVILGGLITLIIIEIARRLIWPRGVFEPESRGRRGRKPSRLRETSGRVAR